MTYLYNTDDRKQIGPCEVLGSAHCKSDFGPEYASYAVIVPMDVGFYYATARRDSRGNYYRNDSTYYCQYMTWDEAVNGAREAGYKS